jgi:hypothetical protein
MFVAFHADAYFSLGGEVLLYFILFYKWELFKVQIYFEFKCICEL